MIPVIARKPGVAYPYTSSFYLLFSYPQNGPMKTGIRFFPFLLFLLLGCAPNPRHEVIDLNRGWTFAQAGEQAFRPAEVPGCVHTDLLALEAIPDPFYRFNEKDLQWIEKEDWIYQTDFRMDRIDPDRQYELLFHGLDTYADVYLNDELIGQTDNMFIAHRFSVKDYLQKGKNRLRVYFHSPVRIGLDKAAQFDYVLPATNEQAPEGEKTNVFTRKAPFHYGWDWGPRYVTSGIWQPVELISYADADIRQVYFKPGVIATDKAEYLAEVEINTAQATTAQLEISVQGEEESFTREVSLEPGQNTLELPFHITDPEFWWAHGMGDPHLYDVEVSLTFGENARVSHSQRLGVRTIEFVNEPDSIGASFYFKLNGRPVFMKGANYIPSDIFVSRQDRAIYERALDDAIKANMNMLRVWGGAIYEKDLFYELCDEKGIMIWQDFMFACSMFPNTPEHLANIEQEAVYNVQRLRKHPSVVFWCGNNENLVGWNNWGWKESFSDEDREVVWAGYRKVFHEILPRAVETYAPELSYWPSSPQSHYDGVMPSNTHGDQHEWSVWFNRQDFSYYWDHSPRFCSEYGVQSYPEMKTVLGFAKVEDLDHDSDLMNNRNRCKLDWMSPGKNGNHLMMDYIERYYRSPRDFEAYVYLSQLMHAKALETGIEAHRAHMPRTMGSLYWQLNDCWPTMSWATVDYFGRWKPGHYAVKRAFENVAVVGQVDSNWVMVYGVSDLPETVEAQLILEMKDFSGETLKMERRDVVLQGNTSTLLHRCGLRLEEWDLTDQAYVQLTLRSAGEILAEKVVFFRDEKELELPKPDIDLTVEVAEGGYTLSLESPVFAAHVVLTTPEVEGFLSENNVHLLPGEARMIHFRTEARGLSPEDFRVYSLRDSYGGGAAGL